MRIVLVLKSFQLGGAERQALLLARFLNARQGIEAQVWSLTRNQNSGRVAQLCDQYQIPRRAVPFYLHGKPPKLLRDLIRLTWNLRIARPTAVISHVDVPNIACGLVWRWTGAQTYIWSQRSPTLIRKHEQRRITRLAIRQTPFFVSNSQAGAEFLVQELGVEQKRIRIIHNGVKLAQPLSDRSTWHSRLGISEDNERCLLVCMVANFTEEKDHETLLRAWSRVIQKLDARYTNAKLILAGRFDRACAAAKSLTTELEIEGSVMFLGQVSDISGLLNAVDLGILSSHSEGLPNAVLEYMAAGLPVVATDLPGIQEAVGKGYPYLAPPKDVEALANHMLELTLDTDRQMQVAARNRQRAETEFSPQQLGEAMLQLIHQGLAT
jgi:glycosyltransferase involved in cell wall biosynthesis